jgi:hypothetical protein
MSILQHMNQGVTRRPECNFCELALLRMAELLATSKSNTVTMLNAKLTKIGGVSLRKKFQKPFAVVNDKDLSPSEWCTFLYHTI